MYAYTGLAGVLLSDLVGLVVNVSGHLHECLCCCSVWTLREHTLTILATLHQLLQQRSPTLIKHFTELILLGLRV